MVKIRLPRLTVNEDTATIHWHVDSRTPVLAGQTVGIAETTKAATDISAPDDGHFYRLVPDGREAAVDEPIAIIHDVGDLSDAAARELVGNAARPAQNHGARRLTKRAELLALAKSIAIEDIPANGDVIKEADVLAFLQQKAALADRPGPAPGAGQSAHDYVDHLYPTNRQQRLLLLGASLGAAVALDAVARLPYLRPIGILDDDPAKAHQTVMGVPVLGPITQAEDLWAARAFDCALCLMHNSRDVRRRVFEHLRAKGIPFANVIDPTAIIHSNVQLGQGNLIMAHARLGPCTVVGDNNFLSAHVDIEHHNKIGSHCTFGPAISTSGEVIIGDNVSFGTGISIEPGVTIGSDSIIGSGTVLVGSVPPRSLVKSKINYVIGDLSGTRHRRREQS